jgi:hypothetical protein
VRVANPVTRAARAKDSGHARSRVDLDVSPVCYKLELLIGVPRVRILSVGGVCLRFAPGGTSDENQNVPGQLICSAIA